MTVKEIRKLTGLNRKEFSKKYNIPLRTLEDWENEKRHPPKYVVTLLYRAVKEDEQSKV